MLCKVFAQNFRVRVEMRFQDGSDGRAKFGMRQRRAERAMKYLATGLSESAAGWDVGPQFQIGPLQFASRCDRRRRGDSGQCGGDVIRGLVSVVTASSEFDDRSEQAFVVACDDSQRFEITRSRRFDVEAALRRSR